MRFSFFVFRFLGLSVISVRSSVGVGRGRNRLSRRFKGDCRVEGGFVFCCFRLSFCFLAKFTNIWWVGVGWWVGFSLGGLYFWFGAFMLFRVV